MSEIEFIRDYERILTTMGLLEAVEDSQYTKEHSLRVGDLVRAVCIELGLDEEIVLLVTRAAYFHDIGKIKIPGVILFKNDKLTDAEFNEIKKHPIYSANILKSIQLDKEAEIDLQHHERLDGTGYPNQLKGDEINPFSQILAVADVYDALITERPYRKGRNPKDVILYLYQNAGVKWKSFIVKALHRVLEKQRKVRKTLDI